MIVSDAKLCSLMARKDIQFESLVHYYYYYFV